MADGGCDDDDLLSALPDDILRLILLRLPSAAAAERTSLLSRRWCHLWTTLPELRFAATTDLVRVSAALLIHDAPVLRHLEVASDNPDPHQISPVLHLAALRLQGVLVFDITESGNQNSVAAGIGGAIRIPCFRKATEITFCFGYLGIRLPPFGVFAKLTVLSLDRFLLDSQCDLGDVVSSQRCPSLRKLRLCRAQGLSNLAIRSESLLHVDLSGLRELLQLTIFAPMLRVLSVVRCFHPTMTAANISAPALETLEWFSVWKILVHFGVMEHLQSLSTFGMAYGESILQNVHSLPHMQRFKAASHVHLTLKYPYVPVNLQRMVNCEFLMEAVSTLPAVKILSLRLLTRGHAFGPCVFHLLRMSAGITELNLELNDDLKAQCSFGCICCKPQDWETNDICLRFLQKVEIRMLSGARSEICFVKRLLRWAQVLKTITITFDTSTAVSEEVCQELLSFSRPEICMEIYLKCNGAKVMYIAKNLKRPSS